MILRRTFRLTFSMLAMIKNCQNIAQGRYGEGRARNETHAWQVQNFLTSSAFSNILDFRFELPESYDKLL